MSILTAALLGFIQGLAEFLPISSSGHLNLLQALFGVGMEHQLLFNLLLHMGTLLAVLVVFWKEWWDMIRHPIKNKTLLLLFIASLPALVGKILFDKQLDYYEVHNVILGACFLFTGLLLLLTQWIARRHERMGKQDKPLGIPQVLAMGVMQAIGMLPGISRSGSTIFGGVASGLNRERAAKFSFMMSAPAIVAGMLSEGYAVIKTGGLSSIGDLPAIAVGMVVAALVGYLAIRFMMKVIAKASLNWFALYVIVLGIVVIALQMTGVLTDAPAELPEAAARILMGA
jgi:undecaprenyl-diphosphatase